MILNLTFISCINWNIQIDFSSTRKYVCLIFNFTLETTLSSTTLFKASFNHLHNYIYRRSVRQMLKIEKKIILMHCWSGVLIHASQQQIDNINWNMEILLLLSNACIWCSPKMTFTSDKWSLSSLLSWFLLGFCHIGSSDQGRHSKFLLSVDSLFNFKL